jgi:hypothetical protein
MNKVLLNRVEEWQRWLRQIIYAKGVFFIETPLADMELEEVIKGMKNVIKLGLFCSSEEQPFNEALVLSITHYLNDDVINKLTDSLMCGSLVHKDSIVSQILFRCFTCFDSQDLRIIILSIRGRSVIEEEDIVLLNNALREQKRSFAVVFASHKVKNSSNQIEINSLFMEKKNNNLDKVHISYKHLTRHAKAIDVFYNNLNNAGIPVSIDKHDVEIRDSIREYENEIGQSKQVIVVITPEYLHSIQCMYELKEIVKNGDMRRRVTAVVEIDDITRDADGLRKVKNYWQNEKTRKAEQIKTEPGQIKVLTNELSIINDIVTELDDVWIYISEIMTGSIEELTANNAQKLIEIIKKALSEDSDSAPIGSISAVSSTTATQTAPVIKEIHQGEKSVYIEKHEGNIIIS